MNGRDLMILIDCLRANYLKREKGRTGSKNLRAREKERKRDFRPVGALNRASESRPPPPPPLPKKT